MEPTSPGSESIDAAALKLKAEILRYIEVKQLSLSQVATAIYGNAKSSTKIKEMLSKDRPGIYPMLRIAKGLGLEVRLTYRIKEKL